MDVCQYHSGIEEKFVTILAEIRALRDSQTAFSVRMDAELERQNERHKTDLEEINTRIDDEVKHRNNMIADLSTKIEHLNTTITGMREDVRKMIIRVLVWLICILGVPIATWFIAQTFNLLVTHKATP